MEKESFNKYNPQDLFTQLIGVLNKEFLNRGQMDILIKDLKNISGKVFTEMKKPEKESSLKQRASKMVESMYYYDKSKVYRPNKGELGSRMFGCPRCKTMMVQPRYRCLNQVYVCPSCGFEAPIDNVLKTQEHIEEYMIENKKKKEIIDMVVGKKNII